MMNRSQINRLGDSIRESNGRLDDETLKRLQDVRAAYDAPMAKAQALLREELAVEATARLKTVNTLVEKLCRERTRLSKMQDIAGLRVVKAMDLGEQDVLATSIAGLFSDAKIHDRRATPSHGYRAVHVIATVDGYPVEIQVRTEMQDRWAQAMERLADQLGRGIRYGEKPTVRAGEVDRLDRISTLIAKFEKARELYRLGQVGLRERRASASTMAEVLAVRQREAELAEMLNDLEEIRAGLSDILSMWEAK